MNIESPLFALGVAAVASLVFATGEFGRNRGDSWTLRIVGLAGFAAGAAAILVDGDGARGWINMIGAGLFWVPVLIGGIPGVKVMKRGKREVIRFAAALALGLLLIGTIYSLSL